MFSCLLLISAMSILLAIAAADSRAYARCLSHEHPAARAMFFNNDTPIVRIYATRVYMRDICLSLLC